MLMIMIDKVNHKTMEKDLSRIILKITKNKIL